MQGIIIALIEWFLSKELPAIVKAILERAKPKPKPEKPISIAQIKKTVRVVPSNEPKHSVDVILENKKPPAPPPTAVPNEELHKLTTIEGQESALDKELREKYGV